MANVKKPNSKSTKNEILDYTNFLEDQIQIYEKNLEKLKSNNPKAQIMDQKFQDRKIAVEKLSIEEVETFSDLFIKELQNYKALTLEIDHQRTILENMYKLRVEADSLIALVTSKQEIADTLNKKIETLEDYYADQTNLEMTKLLAARNQAELTQRADLENKKLKQDYEIKKETIKFNDYKDSVYAQIRKDQNAIDQQKKENEKIYKDMTQLQLQIEQFEKKKNIEIDQIKADLTQTLQEKFSDTMSLVRAKNDKDIAVLECTIDNLKATIDQMDSQIYASNETIKSSVKTVSDLAAKTVDNYQTQKSMTDLKELMKNINDTNKK
jgi:hypothetical protein